MSYRRWRWRSRSAELQRDQVPTEGGRCARPDGRGLAGSGADGAAYELARGVDAPAAGHRRKVVVEGPTVGARGAFVFEARALQHHAARVLADRADLAELLC